MGGQLDGRIDRREERVGEGFRPDRDSPESTSVLGEGVRGVRRDGLGGWSSGLGGTAARD